MNEPLLIKTIVMWQTCHRIGHAIAQFDLKLNYNEHSSYLIRKCVFDESLLSTFCNIITVPARAATFRCELFY